MKYLITVFLLLSISACTPTERSPIKGEKVDLSAPGYEKMCEREPTSPLCTVKNISVTSVKDDKWCELCKIDNTFSWCVKYPSCVPNDVPVQVIQEEIKGTQVNVEADAYEKMCEKNPDSVLCKEQ